MSRSKQLTGVANATPILFGHLIGGHTLPKFYLLQLLVRLLLVADVLPNQRFITTHGRNEIAPGPEMLPDEVTLALSVHPHQMDRALALDLPHNLRYRVLRRYRLHYVHMIRLHGATGCGKTFLACALANQACRQGLSALYVRAPRLFEELNLCHAASKSKKIDGS